MLEILDDLPLNTKRQYVMGTAVNGCEIYIPVDSDDENVLNLKKESLQKYLDNQFESALTDTVQEAQLDHEVNVDEFIKKFESDISYFSSIDDTDEVVAKYVFTTIHNLVATNLSLVDKLFEHFISTKSTYVIVMVISLRVTFKHMNEILHWEQLRKYMLTQAYDYCTHKGFDYKVFLSGLEDVPTI